MLENGKEMDGLIYRDPVKRWGIRLLIPLLILMITLSIASMEWRESLKVRRFVVEGATIIPPQQITTLAKVPMGSLLYSVDILEVQRRLYKHSFIKSVFVSREFPDALHISVVERVPVALVNNGQLLYVDSEGVLLPYLQSTVKFDLPIISGVHSLGAARVGEASSDSELTQAIELIQIAQKIDSSIYKIISEVDMNNGNDIILYEEESGVTIILGRDNVAKKLLILRNFWHNFVKPNEVNKILYVDLRYENQVVVKWQNEILEQRRMTL